jgi:hypothetical protein
MHIGGSIRNRAIVAALFLLAAPAAFAQDPTQLRELASNFGLTPQQARQVFAMYDAQASRIAVLADNNKIDRRLLRSAALRLGAKNPNLDHDEFLRLIESKAIQASSAQAKIAQLELLVSKLQQGEMAVEAQAALAEARSAFDAGQLEKAERSLAQLYALRQSEAGAARDAWKEAVFAQMELLAFAGENERASELAERAARDIADQARHDAWAFAIADAQQWFQRGTLFGERQSLDRSIAILRTRALTLAPLETAVVDWARTQNEIGNVLLVYGQRVSGNPGLEEAASVYRAALQKLARESSPPDWAMLQGNLCAALLALGRPNKNIAMLEEAVAACRTSLLETASDTDPEGRAASEANLSAALVELGVLKRDVGLIAEGIHGNRPANPSTQSDAPTTKPVIKVMEYSNSEEMEEAIHRDNKITDHLAYADYLVRWREEPHAIWHYRQALTEARRQQNPMEWARIHFDLGKILHKMGGSGWNADHLEELETSAASYRSALEVYRRDQVPRYFAIAQGALASTLMSLAEAYLDGTADDETLGLERFHQAIAAYRASADGFGHAGAKGDRAVALADLGCAIIDLSVHENREANLREGVALLESLVKDFKGSADLEEAKASQNAQSCLNHAEGIKNGLRD